LSSDQCWKVADLALFFCPERAFEHERSQTFFPMKEEVQEPVSESSVNDLKRSGDNVLQARRFSTRRHGPEKRDEKTKMTATNFISQIKNGLKDDDMVSFETCVYVSLNIRSHSRLGFVFALWHVHDRRLTPMIWKRKKMPFCIKVPWRSRR
jgi:hypothetical protein